MKVYLHKGQLEIFNDPHRFRVAVMGRRYGKSRLMVWELILRSLMFPGKVDPVSTQTVLGAMPTLIQCKKILWNPLYNLASDSVLSKYVKAIRKSDYTIEFEGGKPPIVLAGANDSDGDRFRGLRIYFFGGDEFQDFKKGIFDTVIMPAMADTKGSRALMTGTPKGRLNHLFELAERSKIRPDLYGFFNHPTWTNPTIKPEEVEIARQTLPPRLFAQEYEASFVDYEGKIFAELGEDNLVESLPTTNFKLTVLGIDWGDTNPALIVLGLEGSTWYYLEGWQPDGRQPIPAPIMDSHIVRLAKKWDVKGTFCDPSRPSSIIGVRALGKQYDCEGLKRAIAGNNRIEEGNNHLHSLLYQKRLMFPKQPIGSSPETISGKEAYLKFEAYHRKADREGNLTEDVAPGQDDHIIDATRYSMVTFK